MALDTSSAWAGCYAYMLQLYFDFSGYCDMASGAALLFNFDLPINFDSPYRAVSIQDFWRRWHITLSAWLRDYIYIPLGGNRSGENMAVRNIFITFLIGGVWHGAAWTFFFWGCLHGIAQGILRLWRRYVKIQLPNWSSWAVTMVFIFFSWILFRAKDCSEAWQMFLNLFRFRNDAYSIPRDMNTAVYLVIGSLLLTMPNSFLIRDFFKKHMGKASVQIVFGVAAALSFGLSVLMLLSKELQASPFLYFQF